MALESIARVEGGWLLGGINEAGCADGDELLEKKEIGLFMGLK